MSTGEPLCESPRFVANIRSLQILLGKRWIISVETQRASARGSTISFEKYRIPLFIYSPAHIEPKRIDRLMSQIDIPPTLLGLLSMSCEQVHGYDVLNLPIGGSGACVEL
jgi:hypothetical protein